MVATTFYVVSATHKYITFGRRILSEPLDAVTCFCIIPCVIYTGSGYILFCALIVFRIDESIELVRSWSEVLYRFNFPGKEEMTAFSQKQTSLICIQVFLAASASALAYPIVSCLLSEMPFFVIATANGLGVVNTDWMPEWLWAVAFTPLEAISYAGPHAILAFVMEVVNIEFGIEKECVGRLR